MSGHANHSNWWKRQIRVSPKISRICTCASLAAPFVGVDCTPEVTVDVALPETVVTVAGEVLAVVGAGAAAGAVMVEKVARLLVVALAAGVDASTLPVGAVWPGSADGGESE